MKIFLSPSTQEDVSIHCNVHVLVMEKKLETFIFRETHWVVELLELNREKSLFLDLCTGFFIQLRKFSFLFFKFFQLF